MKQTALLLLGLIALTYQSFSQVQKEIADDTKVLLM